MFIRDKEECIDVTSIAGSEFGRIWAVYRNGEEVVKVVGELENGDILTFEEWEQDYYWEV